MFKEFKEGIEGGRRWRKVAPLQLRALLPLYPGEEGDHAVGGGLVQGGRGQGRGEGGDGQAHHGGGLHSIGYRKYSTLMILPIFAHFT